MKIVGFQVDGSKFFYCSSEVGAKAGFAFAQELHYEAVSGVTLGIVVCEKNLGHGW